MKVYFYDKDTFEFKREAEANIDPLETELKGEPVYMLPANATFTAPPETGDYEVAVFEKDNKRWVVKPSYKGNYKLNTKTGFILPIKDNSLLKSYEILMTPEIYADYRKNPIKYDIKDGKFIDISKTQKYQTLYNTRLYHAKIKAAQNNYDTFLETPVTYKGMSFYPRYIDDFAKLENRSFPREIWDSTGTQSKVMTKAEFLKLKEYLEELVDKAFKEKKEKIKKYKIAIQKLGE